MHAPRLLAVLLACFPLVALVPASSAQCLDVPALPPVAVDREGQSVSASVGAWSVCADAGGAGTPPSVSGGPIGCGTFRADVPVVQGESRPDGFACADPKGVCAGASAALAVHAQCLSPVPSLTMGYLDAVGGSSDVLLTWVASAQYTTIAYYHVHRSTSANGVYALVANVSASALSPTTGTHLDTGLPSGTFWYYVEVFDTLGTPTSQSNKAAAITTPNGSVFAYGAGVTIAWVPANGNQATITSPGWTCTTISNDVSQGLVEVSCLPLAQNSSWVCKNPFGIAGVDAFVNTAAAANVAVAFDCAGQGSSCTAYVTMPCIATVGPNWNVVTTLNPGALWCGAFLSYADLTDLAGWSVTCFNDP